MSVLSICLKHQHNNNDNHITQVLVWFLKLFPEQVMTAAQLQYRIQKTCLAMESLRQDQLATFLRQNLDFNTVPEDLSEIGLTRSVLLGDMILQVNN